jgi:hypothetical protein
MKTYFTIFLFFLCIRITFGQDKIKFNKITSGHFVTLTYSTNGQLSDVIDEFYFFKGAYSPNDDVFTYKQTEFKVNARYEYVSKKMFSVYGNIGFSRREDSYEISNWSPANGRKNQYFLNFSVGAKYVIQFDRFQFSTGLEIPYYRFSDYKEANIYNDPNLVYQGTTRTDGGNAFGLNNITSIKVFVVKGLFISTDMTFGLLNYQLGGKTYHTTEYPNPPIYPDPAPYVNTYNKTTISKPELYFGIGYSFGEKKKRENKNSR